MPGFDKDSKPSSLRYQGRPASVDIRGQQIELFPFDAFVYDRDVYTVGVNSPWRFVFSDAQGNEITDIELLNSVVDNNATLSQDIMDLQEDVLALSTAGGIPIGGTTGQVIAKASNTNYDVTWVDRDGKSYRTVSVNYLASLTDKILAVTVAGVQVTLPTAGATTPGFEYHVDNVSTGRIFVVGQGGETIQSMSMQIVPPKSCMTVYSTGVHWRIT